MLTEASGLEQAWRDQEMAKTKFCPGDDGREAGQAGEGPCMVHKGLWWSSRSDLIQDVFLLKRKRWQKEKIFRKRSKISARNEGLKQGSEIGNRGGIPDTEEVGHHRLVMEHMTGRERESEMA